MRSFYLCTKLILTTLIFYLAPVLRAQKGHVRFSYIGQERGLSQGNVMDMAQDRLGFLWLGTQDGLNRFDGYDFKVFRHDPDDPGSLSDNHIQTLLIDRDGLLWVGTHAGFLIRFEPRKELFTRYGVNVEGDYTTRNKPVHCLLESRNGMLWVGSETGLYGFDPRLQEMSSYRLEGENLGRVSSLLEEPSGSLLVGTKRGLLRFDPQSGQFSPLDADVTGNLATERVHALLEDKRGRIWAGTAGGLYLLDPAVGPDFRYRGNSGSSVRNVYTFLEDRDGTVWAGTAGGLARLDPHSGWTTTYAANVADPLALQHPKVISLLEDRVGNLWVGTGNGLHHYDRGTENFVTYRHDPSDPASLGNANVFSVLEDNQGNVWVGTEDGLDHLDPVTEQVTRYGHDPDDQGGLVDGAVISLMEAADGDLWVGTTQGLNRLDAGTGRFTRYLPDPDHLASPENDTVRCLYQDRTGTIWIGTGGGGLHSLNDETKELHHFRNDPLDPNSLSDDRVNGLLMAGQTTLWVATQGGLNRFDTNGSFTRYLHRPEDPTSLGSDWVLSLHEDRNGHLWVGTNGGGLHLLQPEQNGFRGYRSRDGLPNNTVYGILSDDLGMLWLSTNQGLSRFDPKRESFESFGFHDGLQGDEFNQGAYARGKSGRLYFGGNRGLNAFYPEHLNKNDEVPSVVLTSFQIDHRSAGPEDLRSSSPPDEVIEYRERMVLNHGQAALNFSFAAPCYSLSPKVAYAYRLEGFDRDWVTTTTNRRTASYTNLGSGTYWFRVKASNREGVWNEEATAVEIRILPPWWRSPGAYALYVIAMILLVAISARLRGKTQAPKEPASASGGADVLKNRILANTSHELRTPLNGIIGVTESLLDGVAGPLNHKLSSDLTMIAAAGKRLAALVNDILDLSKMEGGELTMQLEPVNLHAATEVVLALSAPLAGGKDLVLRNEVEPGLPPVRADENRVQQIFHNLVGNAVKFTQRGSVTVSARVNESHVEVSVVDTGIGIPTNQHHAIFESFHQLDAVTSREYQGTGLGLSITRKLVEQLGGEIGVRTNKPQGSIFFFSLPLHDETDQPERIAAPVTVSKVLVREEPCAMGAEKQASLPRATRGHILVVDDEPMNRLVITNLLSLESYRLTEVGSGAEALAFLDREPSVDLVLLDIMMPTMSGYEVCQRLREKTGLQNLPVIVLTARNQESDLTRAFEAGANDFITKPFGKLELLARINTQLELLNLHRNLEARVRERTEDLVRAQEALVETAHQAGMAEIASELLHHMGNQLNSVMVATQLICTTARQHKWPNLLEKIQTLVEQQEDLGQFFQADPRARRVPQALTTISSNWKNQMDFLEKESLHLEELTKHMSSALRSHLDYIDKRPVSEALDLNRLVEEALRMKASLFESQAIAVRQELQPLPLVPMQKAKVIRMLSCLLENAREAVINVVEPEIVLHTRHEGDVVRLDLSDNGTGIDAEIRDKCCLQGFTTKKGGQGFGLHYTATVMAGLAGRVEIHSDGHRGVTVRLYFPLERANTPQG